MSKKKVEYYNKYINNLLTECFDDIAYGYYGTNNRPACPSGIKALDETDYNKIFENDQKRWVFKPKFCSVLHCELYYVYMFRLVYSKYVPANLIKKMKAYLKKYKKLRHKNLNHAGFAKKMLKIDMKYACSYSSSKTTSPAVKPAPIAKPTIAPKPKRTSASSSQYDYYDSHQKEVDRTEEKIREFKRIAGSDICKVRSSLSNGYTKVSPSGYVSGVHSSLVSFKNSISDDVWNDLPHLSKWDLECLIDEYEKLARDYGNTL